MQNKILAYSRGYFGNKINTDNLTGLVLIYIFWPFAAFLFALRRYYTSESKIIIVLFTTFFAYNMLAENAGLDLHRVLQYPEIYARYSSTEIFKIVGGLYSPDKDSSADIYKDLVAFFVSRFTTNGRLILFVFGLFYAFFYIKSIQIFQRYYNHWYNIHYIILLACFSFIFGLDQLAGVRYATAAYVFFIGAVKFIETKKKHYLWFVAGAPLIHFSYLSLVLILGIFFLIRKFNIAIYGILGLSFVVPTFIGSYIEQVSALFGGAVQDRTEMYIFQGKLLGAESTGLVWYVNYREELMLYYALAVLLFTRVYSRKLLINKFTNSVYFYSLLLLSLTNFTNHIPNAGYRFQFNFFMFVVFYIFLLFKDNFDNNQMKRVIYYAVPAFALHIIYGLRGILYYSSPITYAGNWFTTFIADFDQSTWTILFK